jgi:beta-lactamase regulating signal transducer with metallopeptidase domain
MNVTWASPASWLLHTAVGGGAILLLTTVLMRCTRQPARRQRLGEIGLAAALVVAVLGLGPSWLQVPVSWDVETALPPAKVPSDPLALAAPTVPPGVAGEEGLEDFRSDEVIPASATLRKEFRELDRPAPRGETPTEDASSARQTLAALLVGAFVLGSGLLLVRWLVGHVALWRLLHRAGPAPEAVARLFASVVGGRPPRLLVSRRLRVPMSCGLCRPTVVLPARLCDSPDAVTLRWVFAHELTHLERRDAWSSWLFGLGQAVYYYLPWFWGLRRQVRLCQEFVADAAATERGAPAADYAEFLLTLTRRPALPVGATGVLGHASDLFRRVTMLLQEPLRVEKRCPRRWALAAAASLLALAVLAAGVGLGGPLTPAAAEEPTKNKEDVRVLVVPEPPAKAETPRKVEVRIVKPDMKDVAEIFKGIQIQITRDGKVIKVIKLPAEKRAAVERAVRILKIVQDGDVKKEVLINRDVNVLLNDVLKRRLPKDLKIKVADVLQGVTLDPSANPAQVQKEMARIVQRLQGQPLQIEVPLGADNADIQKEIQKALEEIKLQQRKLEKLRKAMQDRARAARVRSVPAHLGVQLAPPGPTLADQLDLPRGLGMVVVAVVPDSAAAKGGIKPNDVLLMVAGKQVMDEPGSIARILASLKPGAPFEVVVLRKGKKETLKGLTLAEVRKREVRQQPRIIQGYGFPQGGIQVIGQRNHSILTTVVRTGDKFTTRYQEGNLIITLTGTVADGKAKVGHIYVQDGSGQPVQCDSLDKVPEQYRGKVKNLVEMSEKGQVQVDVKQP